MSKTKKRAMIKSSDESGSSEVEQELKSLAKRPKAAPVSAVAQSSSSGSSSESGSDDEWTVDGKEKKRSEKERRKGKGGRVQVGKRMPAGRKAVAHHSTSESSNEEEGEEEDTQGMSQSTSSSETSSSESDSSSDESIQFDDGLDEKLVSNEEDRRKLADMMEAEREQEMYIRYEKRQALKARFEIEQKLRRERRVKKKKAREVREREQSSRLIRKSRRSRQEDSSKSKAMDELKAKRSADKQKREEQQRQASSSVVVKEPLNAAEVYSSGSEQETSSSSGSESEAGDSEDEDGSPSGAHDSTSRFVSSVDEVTKIKLSRFRLEKWVHMPFFRDVAVGCYVRVGIGAHEGRMVYRVCEITDVMETPKIYSLGPTKTNKCLKLRHGQQERSFRMEYVSNSPFTDSEFTKWKKELEQRGHSLPTTDYIRKKSKHIEEAKNFHFKEEDIEKILLEKQKFRKTPTNYAMTKSRLLRQKELAEQEEDSETVSSLTLKLSELEEKAEQLDKQRSKGLSAISYINERNRQRNVSRAEQALKEEMADDKKKKDDDPFTRRRCKPTLVNLTKEANLEGPMASKLLHQLSKAQTEEDKEAIKASLREAAPQILSPTTPNGQNPASLTTALQATPDASLLSSTPAPPHHHDLFSAHDFDIHIDMPSTPEGTSTVKTLNKSAVVSTPRTEEAPKRSLNLADYKKRRGLI